jgi:hypothetical protein
MLKSNEPDLKLLLKKTRRRNLENKFLKESKEGIKNNLVQLF